MAGNPWKAKVLSFNRIAKERADKAEDMDVVVAALLALPPGQLKKMLTDDVLAVLAKYGYEHEA